MASTGLKASGRKKGCFADQIRQKATLLCKALFTGRNQFLIKVSGCHTASRWNIFCLKTPSKLSIFCSGQIQIVPGREQKRLLCKCHCMSFYRAKARACWASAVAIELSSQAAISGRGAVTLVHHEALRPPCVSPSTLNLPSRPEEWRGPVRSTRNEHVEGARFKIEQEAEKEAEQWSPSGPLYCERSGTA